MLAIVKLGGDAMGIFFEENSWEKKKLFFCSKILIILPLPLVRGSMVMGSNPWSVLFEENLLP